MIIVDTSFPEPERRDFQVIAEDVWTVVSEAFHSRPPLDLPIICHKRSDGPFTALNDWANPDSIIIGLSVSGSFWAQFVYQLSHELGHVMLDPRRTNGVVETICVALSYEVLDRLARKWQEKAPLPHMNGWGHNFSDYRKAESDNRIRRLGEISSAVSKDDWEAVREYLISHRDEQEQTLLGEINGEHGRDIQALGALALCATGQVPWPRFVGLAAACCDVPLSEHPVGWLVGRFVPGDTESDRGMLFEIGR